MVGYEKKTKRKKKKKNARGLRADRKEEDGEIDGKRMDVKRHTEREKTERGEGTASLDEKSFCRFIAPPRVERGFRIYTRARARALSYYPPICRATPRLNSHKQSHLYLPTPEITYTMAAAAARFASDRSSVCNDINY